MWITWGRFWKGIDMIHIQPLLVFVVSLVSKDRSCVNESFTTERLIDFVFFSVLVVL